MEDGGDREEEREDDEAKRPCDERENTKPDGECHEYHLVEPRQPHARADATTGRKRFDLADTHRLCTISATEQVDPELLAPHPDADSVRRERTHNWRLCGFAPFAAKGNERSEKLIRAKPRLRDEITHSATIVGAHRDWMRIDQLARRADDDSSSGSKRSDVTHARVNARANPWNPPGGYSLRLTGNPDRNITFDLRTDAELSDEI